MPDYLGITQEAAALTGSIDRRNVTTVNATGRVGRLAALVKDSWTTIQSEYRAWRFLRVEFPEDAIIGEGATTFTAESLNLENWDWWITGEDYGDVRPSIWPGTDETHRGQEQELVHQHYRPFRETYQTGTSLETRGRPTTFAIDEQDNLVVWPVPDQDYRIRGTYRRSPQVLEKGTDVPIIAEQFHNTISAYAVWLFHQVDEAEPNALITARQRYERRLGALRRRYLPIPSEPAFEPLGIGRRGSYRASSPVSQSISA